ncbi:hypothetical protein COV81_00305 [Candidatus Peregrinibacteria bacterium CG11_big_fil_rev_8_21_14_0_20_41_10]|nr:MAG: hypothetical protein COV81_00305 [Candidatus Peregrinibacteria bacterium CG11_big_fil_rev_8_21_14_0_20_41_10]PIZ76818.1 MAG: hypothetical protein COY06_01370 [Candidatus Peregrinibacteria bacterium CG_4_10_14_0_2_um_filter_41_8]
MITSIHYNFNTFTLSFLNSDEERINYSPEEGYQGVFSFKVINNKEIICILRTNKKQPDELRRRNVVKIDENGKEVWRVSDRTIWTGDPSKTRFGRFSIKDGKESIKIWSESTRRSPFGGFEYDKKTGRLAIGGGDDVFYLDPDTGQLEYWYLEWPTPE